MSEGPRENGIDDDDDGEDGSTPSQKIECNLRSTQQKIFITQLLGAQQQQQQQQFARGHGGARACRIHLNGIHLRSQLLKAHALFV